MPALPDPEAGELWEEYVEMNDVWLKYEEKGASEHSLKMLYVPIKDFGYYAEEARRRQLQGEEEEEMQHIRDAFQLIIEKRVEPSIPPSWFVQFLIDFRMKIRRVFDFDNSTVSKAVPDREQMSEVPL